MSEMIEKVVTFLEETKALKLGKSPWPTVEPEEQSLAVDWERLFPGAGPDWRSPDEFRADVGAAMARGEGFEEDEVLDPIWSQREDPWQPNLSEALLDRLRAVLQNPEQFRRPMEGVKADICAWYQPIHFHAYDWGIFIREECIQDMALQIAAYVILVKGMAPIHTVLVPLMKASLRAAFAVFFLHEQYHHKTECFGIRNQVVLDRRVYTPYFNYVYRPQLGTDAQMEEALANADMWCRLGTAPYKNWLGATVLKGAKDFLKATFPHEPPGYRMADHFLEKDKFQERENLLQAQINTNSITPLIPFKRWDLAPRMMQSFLPITGEIHTVLPVGAKSVMGGAVMPVRTCSTAELIKLAMSRGWAVVDGGKGSHVKLKKTNSPMIIVPGNRKEVSPGATRQTLRILGNFSLNDLPELLHG